MIVRGRKRPIEILFNLDHPEGAPEFVEVEGHETSPTGDEADEDGEEEDDKLQERLKRLAFVIASKALLAQPNWVPLTDIFGGKSDAQILKDAGLTGFEDPRYERYKDRIERVRSIQNYSYTMHILGRGLSYEEVTEIFVRVNSLGVKCGPPTWHSPRSPAAGWKCCKSWSHSRTSARRRTSPSTQGC